MSISLLERDRKVVWHPYTQHGLNPNILPVKSAEGAYLNLEGGERVLDGISSWWVNLHGHAHPRIVQAISDQCSKMEHVIFAGFTHEPAVKLAESLIQGASESGGNFARVFFSDNGSTAVEAALKMAFQYHLNRKDRGRSRFIALRNSYHGDTFGAMAVGEPDGFHPQFRALLPRVDFVEPDCFDDLERLMRENPDSYAAFIFEPMIQAAGGMRIYSRDFLKAATELCKKNKILTISDEVFTGFFRTGSCFAFEHAGVSPDLLCLSKGITGGFLPLAATLTSEELYSAFLSSEMKTAFLHGHSYTANPIACAAANESWSLLMEPSTQDRIIEIQRLTLERVTKIKTRSSKIKDARSIGTIGAVEIQSAHTYFNPSRLSVVDQAISMGILLRPLGNVIYAVPPYCCTPSEIEQIYDVIEEIIHEF